MKSYLCANNHHFRSKAPRCPFPGCDAEVRPTAMDPSTDGGRPDFSRLPRLAQDESNPAPEPASTADVRHSIRWWAYVDGDRVRRTSSMRDGDYTWDATCACGWDSGTGGLAMTTVDQLVQEHKR